MNQHRKPDAPPPPKPAVDEKPRKGISRREFARRAAIASAVASWAPVHAVAAAASPQPAQAQQPPNLPQLSPESEAEVETRVQSILGQFEYRFSEEQKADIRRLCTMTQPQLDRLRAYNLQNGDNPALYLKPLVERENKKPAPPTRAAAARAPSSAAAKTPAAKTPDSGTKAPASGAPKKP